METDRKPANKQTSKAHQKIRRECDVWMDAMAVARAEQRLRECGPREGRSSARPWPEAPRVWVPGLSEQKWLEVKPAESQGQSIQYLVDCGRTLCFTLYF